jgi:hypothetical protein
MPAPVLSKPEAFRCNILLMHPETMLEILRAAYAVCQTADERSGVHITACEIAVRLFPAYKDYIAFLEAAMDPTKELI